MTLDDRLDQVWNDAKNDPLEEAYGFTIKEVRLAILSDLLELIGEDERIIDSTSDIHAYFITAKHQLREELRTKLKDYFGITE